MKLCVTRRGHWARLCVLALVIPFACRATVGGPRRPPPPALIEVSFPAGITMWVQDLVHWDGHVYGLFHHYGDPRLSGLWRVNIATGEFTPLRFRSDATECRLPLNRFEIGNEGMHAVFFCPPGCAPEFCSGGHVRDADAETPLMPYQGEVEAQWGPAVHRGPSGTIEGWRYSMDDLRQPQGEEPGRFLLERTEKKVRGRE